MSKPSQLRVPCGSGHTDLLCGAQKVMGWDSQISNLRTLLEDIVPGSQCYVPMYAHTRRTTNVQQWYYFCERTARTGEREDAA